MPLISPPGVPTRSPRRARPRRLLAVATLMVLGSGLAVSRGDGLVADLAGGVLYAALVQLLVLLVVPSARAATAASVALAACVVVELAQLTPVPALVGAAWPPAAYVLGSTFVATDLLAYAGGVAVVSAVDLVSGRHRPGPRAR